MKPRIGSIVRRYTAMALLLNWQLYCGGLAKADAWQGTLATRASAEYETNPAMSSTQHSGVWQGIFDASYTLAGRALESEIATGLALQMARASNKILSPDRDSPSLFLNWLRPGKTREIGLSTRYSEMSTRDAGGVDATGRVPVDSIRSSRMLSGNWREDLTERSSLSAEGAYERVTYKGGGSYTDFSSRSGGLKFSYFLNEQITSFVGASGSKYTPVGGGPSSSLVDVTFGLNWRAEYIDGSMQVGKSRVVGGRSDTQGLISVVYAGPKARLALNGSRAISPSGLGGFVKTDLLRSEWSYAISEYSNTGIDLERRKDYFLTASDATTTLSTSGIWIDQYLTSFWNMRAYCRHRTAHGESVESGSSNILGFSFAYSNPDF